MLQKNWDKYEIALLIEAYQNIKQGRVDKNSALVALSQNLRKMAQNEGLNIDDTFRNLNGMQWQLGYIKLAFENSYAAYETKRVPELFIQMTELYKENRHQFDIVLQKAYQKTGVAEKTMDEDKSNQQHMIQKVNSSGFSTTQAVSVVPRPVPSRTLRTKIERILGEEYDDFLDFCSASGKEDPMELTSTDYVAFRVKYDVSREYIAEIRDKIADAKLGDDTASINAVAINDESLEVISEFPIIQDTVSESSVPSVDSDDVSIDGIKVLDELGKQNEPRTEIKFTGQNGRNVMQFNGYNMVIPIKDIFNITDFTVFIGISLESMEIGKNACISLKANQIYSPIDVMELTIAQLIGYCSRIATKNILERIEWLSAADELDLIFLKVATPLYELFKISDVESYKGVAVSSVDFGVRFTNVLVYNKIHDIYDLLQLTISEIKNCRNLGKNTLQESIQLLYHYFKNPDRKIFRPQKILEKEARAKKLINELIDKRINGENPDTSELSDDVLNRFRNAWEGIEICGSELFFSVREKPDEWTSIGSVLIDFYKEPLRIMEQREKFITLRTTVSQCIGEIKVGYLLDATREKYSFAGLVDDEKYKMTVVEFIDYVYKNFQDFKESSIDSIESFLASISQIDIVKIANSIFSKEAVLAYQRGKDELTGKYWFVIEQRAAGATLEGVGAAIDATRERVRQIEKKQIKIIASAYQNSDYDLLSLIRAFRNGDSVLRRDEIADIIGESNTNILWLLAAKNIIDSKQCTFSHSHNAFVFIENIQEEREKLNQLYQELPDLIFKDEFESVISSMAQKLNVQLELALIEMEGLFRTYGKVYMKHTPTVVFMCGYVLKNYFKDGFKISDEYHYKYFQKFMIDIFGKKGDMTSRALDSIIGRVGVLCDRGRYIHPDYISVDETIVKKINDYIEESPKKVLSYIEIYDALKPIFEGTQINNRYIMQGVLCLYGCKYKTTRDVVTKEEGRSLTDEFEEFARGIGVFSKEDFFAAFSGMNEFHLGQLVNRCKQVFGIDNGMYMHETMLHLTEKDYTSLRKYLTEAVEVAPANSRVLYDEACYKFSDFITRNEIYSYTKLFGILWYMFSDEFAFSRPFIAQKGVDSLNKKSVLLHRLDGIDTISIDEVAYICDENGIKYQSTTNLIKMLSPEYLRIDEQTLMRTELTGVNDAVISDVVEIVSQAVKNKGYCCSPTIDDFIYFPHINVSWNYYLVEAIVDLREQAVNIIIITSSSRMPSHHIFVSEEYANDSYMTFILKIVGDAYNKGYFSTKKEMQEWLFERYLLGSNNLPNFLSGTEYYYMSDEGELIKRTDE